MNSNLGFGGVFHAKKKKKDLYPGPWRIKIMCGRGDEESVMIS